MAIDQKELGRRLRRARTARGMTQDDVARHLGVSRSTVAQMEAGNRVVSGLELSRLAYLFGMDLRSFVADDAPDEEDALVALFRRDPELSKQADVFEVLRRCMALGRELTNLERLLGVDRDGGAVAAYPLPRPRTKWEAIAQGERVAVDERRRLGLGLAPLPDVAELIESQGVRTAQVRLPDDVSGLTLIDPDMGILVVANREHHVLRRRFSYAHEYGHVLVDRDRRGLVSRGRDRDDLLEVRANAFAAAFLMPAEAVRQFVATLGKGRPSRMAAEVFDEEAPVRARARAVPGSQDIQLYDVVLMAHHFGVSRAAACYRLKSLRLITQPQLDALLERDRTGRGRALAALLGLPEPDHRALRDPFRHRFLGLALDAFRREAISRAKLLELAAMLDVKACEVERVIVAEGLVDDEGTDVLIPEA